MALRRFSRRFPRARTRACARTAQVYKQLSRVLTRTAGKRWQTVEASEVDFTAWESDRVCLLGYASKPSASLWIWWHLGNGRCLAKGTS